jgi:hypothetical protein
MLLFAGMVQAQREKLIESVRVQSRSGTVYPGLNFTTRGNGYFLELEHIPGVSEAGWKAKDLGIIELGKDRAALDVSSIITTASVGKHIFKSVGAGAGTVDRAGGQDLWARRCLAIS